MSKKKSIKWIIFSLVLIIVGIIFMMIAVERINSGWYREYSFRPFRAEARAVMFPVILILIGCINFYRGLRGKSFRWEIFSIISGHEDGSPYACPHCGAKLEKGLFSCLICGKRII